MHSLESESTHNDREEKVENQKESLVVIQSI